MRTIYTTVGRYGDVQEQVLASRGGLVILPV